MEWIIKSSHSISILKVILSIEIVCELFIIYFMSSFNQHHYLVNIIIIIIIIIIYIIINVIFNKDYMNLIPGKFINKSIEQGKMFITLI